MKKDTMVKLGISAWFLIIFLISMYFKIDSPWFLAVGYVPVLLYAFFIRQKINK
ncbi:MAG: hypothetical protein RR537_07270 [Longicatena sp.]